MTEELLSAAFLFRYSLPVKHRAELSKPGTSGLKLPEAYALPTLRDLSSRPANFGELRVAWNAAGLGFSLTVRGKQTPTRSSPTQLNTSDSLLLWIDTRNTQNIHRASRFCHQFIALPGNGRGEKSAAHLQQLTIARAREEAPLAATVDLAAWSRLHDDGYQLDVWLGADALQGYDPESSPKLGFFYQIRDRELGDQTLSVDAEFPFDHDPSLWVTLELHPA